MKIRPVVAKLFRAKARTAGQTDGHDEANGRFSQFCRNASKRISCVTQNSATNRTILHMETTLVCCTTNPEHSNTR
jgi:hypothetical protein